MTYNYNNSILGDYLTPSGNYLVVENPIVIQSGSINKTIIGNSVASSGNFSSLTVNSTRVSLIGHTHSITDITDFNSAVSGLIPSLPNSSSNNIPNTLVLRDSIGNFSSNEPTFNVIQLNTASGVIEQNLDLNPAEIAWNSDQGTLDYGLIGNGTNLIHHIGQEIFYKVHNGSSSTLYAGMAVSAIGVNANGKRISVAPYVADGGVREVRFVGIVSADILTGENGYVTHFGFVRKLDTRATVATNFSNSGENWQTGDILYVDPTTPGKLTKIEPKHSISVAIVTNVNQNNGLIFVRPTSYGHLNDNHDVSVSGVTNGQFLQYNSTTDYWVPSSSGNFTSLTINNVPVSTGININNFGDNRILTSVGTSNGINAENNATFDGNLLSINGTLSISQPSGFMSYTPVAIGQPELGPGSTLRIVQTNRAVGPSLQLAYHGDTGEVTDLGNVKNIGTPRISFRKTQGTQNSQLALQGWEDIAAFRFETINAPETETSIVGRFGFIANGLIEGPNIYQPTDMIWQATSGPQYADKNLRLKGSTSTLETNCSMIVENGLSSPTPILDLGSVFGNVSISYGVAKQIQQLTLNGTSTNLIKGSDWPTVYSADVLLEITVSSTTTVVFSIVNEWYNPVPTFNIGKYLILLRSMGSTIQGHYIGNKTN